MLRDTIKSAQIQAMKEKDKERLAAVRLILAKIKDRDIEMRTGNALGEPADDDAMVIEVLQKMAKQRKESIAMYNEGGRAELAAAEQGELAVIEEFLPQQMNEAETKDAIEKIKTDTGATGMKDMGKVMAELKARHGAVLDMSNASRLVKESLA
ncbi:GatB/YqeY domain-containing protein [uncultured Croceicoccus sp.]|uniref:GatB/YqeY domain-containing protein n=1 Tax=uncultured Croceicoccus sp. TaxID=1295329 RepID=UPI00260AF96B|nr:GatB/YqeY domain-containing protein [uncultured Croceicoccus sp.]